MLKGNTPHDAAALDLRLEAADRIAGLSGLHKGYASALVRTLGEDLATELCLRDLMERVA